MLRRKSGGSPVTPYLLWFWFCFAFELAFPFPFPCPLFRLQFIFDWWTTNSPPIESSCSVILYHFGACVRGSCVRDRLSSSKSRQFRKLAESCTHSPKVASIINNNKLIYTYHTTYRRVFDPFLAAQLTIKSPKSTKAFVALRLETLKTKRYETSIPGTALGTGTLPNYT